MSDNFYDQSNKKFLNGNKTAIFTFILSISIAFILIIVGLIVSTTKDNKADSSSSVVRIYDGSVETINAGVNKFKFYASSSSVVRIQIYDTTNIKSVRIKDSSGQEVYTSYDAKSYYYYSVYYGDEFVLEIQLYNGALDTKMSLSID